MGIGKKDADLIWGHCHKEYAHRENYLYDRKKRKESIYLEKSQQTNGFEMLPVAYPDISSDSLPMIIQYLHSLYLP
jgi:hypothetical protein